MPYFARKAEVVAVLVSSPSMHSSAAPRMVKA